VSQRQSRAAPICTGAIHRPERREPAASEGGTAIFESCSSHFLRLAHQLPASFQPLELGHSTFSEPPMRPSRIAHARIERRRSARSVRIGGKRLPCVERRPAFIDDLGDAGSHAMARAIGMPSRLAVICARQVVPVRMLLRAVMPRRWCYPTLRQCESFGGGVAESSPQAPTHTRASTQHPPSTATAYGCSGITTCPSLCVAYSTSALTVSCSAAGCLVSVI
jgi:hypothetical protein